MQQRKPINKRQLREWLWSYLFLAPFLILFILFTTWPAVASISWAFTDFHVPGKAMKFIGLENFKNILQDDLFWRSFKNTILFALGNTIIKLPLSLLLALFLTRKWVWGKSFFRTIYFLPIVVPSAIVGLIFAILLHPLNGALPSILHDLGVISRRTNIFFGNYWASMITIIVVSVWQIFGKYMIYWIAALQNVPEEIQDAAKIDGAGFWQELFHVTLPSIRPIAIIITFLGLVNAFRVFGIVLTLTAGGPGTRTFVMQLWVYDRAFRQIPFQYGYVSAGGLLFALLVVIIFIIQSIAVRRAQRSMVES